jgi:hypothetical protein
MGRERRLEIVLDDEEAEAFERTARRAGLSLGEWALQSLREALGPDRTSTGSEAARDPAARRAPPRDA